MLALDYGSARTGVAVSDPTGTVARPLEVVERARSDAGVARILELAKAEEVERIVVGLPVTLRGEPSSATPPPIVRPHAGRALAFHCR